MSREGAGEKTPKAPPPAGTPIWVWLVYGLGLLGASIIVFSALFTIGGVYLSEDGDGSFVNASVTGFVIWGGLVVAAVVVWVMRRRQR